MSTMKDMWHLSFGEEVGNAVSHGVMAVICLLAIPFVAVYAYLTGGIVKTIGESIYIICIFLMFLISTIYHSMDFSSKQKVVFRKLDHCCIFLAIAGTYTPILLYAVKGVLGYGLLIWQWLVTIVGILLTTIPKKHYKKLEMFTYLSMGWAAVLILPTLISKLSLTFLIFIVIGGILYTVGAIFYSRKFPYAHFIWHIFITLAGICHFIAVVFLL